MLVVGAVHYGEVDGGAGNVDPPHHVGVDGPQSVPIDGEACKVHALKRSGIGGVEADLLELLVVLLAVPIAVADEGQRACGAYEHDEGDDEHHAPYAARAFGLAPTLGNGNGPHGTLPLRGCVRAARLRAVMLVFGQFTPSQASKREKHARRLRSSSETSSTCYIVRNIPRSGDMPPAKCPKSTQDVRKTAQHLHGAAANSRPTGTQGASPSKHALYALKFLAARKSRMRCAAGGETIARENARERTVHDARRAPSPRTAARHSAFGLFLLHLVEKALQDEADDHDDYDRDYDRNRPTWHHNATPFPLYMRRPSPTGRRPAPNVVIQQYYRAFTRRATAPQAHR